MNHEWQKITERCQKSHTNGFLQYAAIVYFEERMDQRKAIQLQNVTET